MSTLIAGQPVTVSIGVSTATGADISWDEMARQADEAVYAAKAAGRDRVVVCGLGSAALVYDVLVKRPAEHGAS